MTDVLQLKYRPKTLVDVVGQEQIVAALQSTIKRGSSHAFLFSGPSGCGKTTLARIVASSVGCTQRDVLEVDAATYTGIDDVRALTATLAYKPLGDSRVRALIIDECHALSKQAWQSLLKIVEEPPAWVYWFFCTTEASRVPETIKTRCSRFDVREVPWKILASDLLTPVARAEKLKASADVISLCAKEAKGSPRQALVNLAVCADVTDSDDAAELMASAAQSAEAVDLARALMKGESWDRLAAIIKALQGSDPESVRQVVRAYATTVALGTSGAKVPMRALAILDAFSTPMSRSDGVSPLLLAVGALILG